MSKQDTAEHIAQKIWDHLREKNFINEAWAQYGILVKREMANIIAECNDN